MCAVSQGNAVLIKTISYVAYQPLKLHKSEVLVDHRHHLLSCLLLK